MQSSFWLSVFDFQDWRRRLRSEEEDLGQFDFSFVIGRDLISTQYYNNGMLTSLSDSLSLSLLLAFFLTRSRWWWCFFFLKHKKPANDCIILLFSPNFCCSFPLMKPWSTCKDRERILTLMILIKMVISSGAEKVWLEPSCNPVYATFKKTTYFKL